MAKKKAPTKKPKPVEIPLAGMNTVNPATADPVPSVEDPPMTNQIHDDDEKPDAEKVKVKALKFHSHAGEEHQEGDTYEVDADQVSNLVAQGMVAVEE